MYPVAVKWYVMSTVEPGCKPVYFVVNGTTMEFHRRKQDGKRPWRYNKLENALKVRDRLNDREEYKTHQAFMAGASDDNSGIESERRY